MVNFLWMSLVAAAAVGAVEFSEDGRLRVAPDDFPPSAPVFETSDPPFSLTPDWQNSLRRQVGGLEIADMNNDGWNDVVVGCYESLSQPAYETWVNYIYYNTGGQLEAQPSWISDDERSTADIQVADINNDGFPDILAVNGYFSYDASVIYYGGQSGPDTTGDWFSAVPDGAWGVGGAIDDLNNDGFLDVVTANQGNGQFDPVRPAYAFYNNNGALETVPNWQSAPPENLKTAALGNFNGDPFPDLLLSKWSGFESGVYVNNAGTLQTSPSWTNGQTGTDRGSVWADIDQNGFDDAIIGEDTLQAYMNNNTVLTPGWTGESTLGAQDLKSHDFNKDGFPDVVEISFGGAQARVYINQNGALPPTSTWFYDGPGVGTAIAFGDINGDGWDDLVLGFSGNPSLQLFLANPPAILLGDINGDGLVNAADIECFVDVVVSGAECAPGVSLPAADINGDGLVDARDIEGFVDCVVNGACR